MNHQASPTDQAYLKSFLNLTLDPTTFHHKQHLQIAYTLLVNHPASEAMDILRQGLQRLLSHIGAPADKYHETITRAWLLIVKHAMATSQYCDSFDTFINGHAGLLDTMLLHSHYSSLRLASPEAHDRFVEADIVKIPVYDK